MILAIVALKQFLGGIQNGLGELALQLNVQSGANLTAGQRVLALS